MIMSCIICGVFTAVDIVESGLWYVSLGFWCAQVCCFKF